MTLAVLALACLLAPPGAAAENAASFETQAAGVEEAARRMFQNWNARAAGAPADFKAAPSPADEIQPAGLPALGKWMLDSKGYVADWLGDRRQGKLFAEPINVVLQVDTSDPEIARAKLIGAAREAGFTDQYGHTSGYQARLAGELTRQYPDRPEHAFSDGSFLSPNDHGRLFGPVLWRGREYFIGAFSREHGPILSLPSIKFRHRYMSFVQARERLVSRMTSARFKGYVEMENAISPSDPARTTGDHDGRAALFELE